MYIKRLEIKNFRSYKHLQLNPDKDLNFFLGANATGKTNILESIYYAALLRSPKTNLEKEIIRFGEEFSVIKMEIVKKHVTNEIKIYLNRQGEKKILIDDDIFLKYIVDKKNLLPIAFIFSANISYEYGVENLTVVAKYFNINNVKTIILPDEAKNVKK